MPTKPALKRFLFSIAVILCTLTAYNYFVYVPSKTNSKAKALGFVNEKVLRTQKMVPGFNIELTTDTPTPIVTEQQFHLTAQIHTDVPLSRPTFIWSIPAGIEVVSGLTAGSMNPITVTDEPKLDIVLINRTSENQIINITISDNGNISSSAQFHTANQDAIKQEMSEIFERNQEYLQENPELIKGFK